jgi:hypothetical protein
MLPVKLRPLHGLCASLLLAGVSLPLAGGVRAEPSPPSLTKPYQQKNLQTVRASSAMTRCLATWDRSSQMSRREWRETCKRVVKNNPGLYNKPF